MLLIMWVPRGVRAQEDDGTGEPAEPTHETDSSQPGIIHIERPSDDEPDPDGTEDGQTDQLEDPDGLPIEPPLPQDWQPFGPGSDVDNPPLIEPRDLVGGDVEYPLHFNEEFDPFRPPPDVRVTIDFPDAELTDVVLWMSALTGQNFIIADNVHEGERITIIGPSPVTMDEAYAAFMAALHMNGLTIVPYGSFLRIVQEDSIGQQALPFTPRGSAPRDDRMVTQLIHVDYIDANELSDFLGSMTTERATIQVYAPTNLLIITETGTNIRRLLVLIEELDQPGGDNRFVYQVRYADADELRGTLLEIFEEEGGAEESSRRRRRDDDDDEGDTEGGPVSVTQIIADQRTNQLIIVSSARSYDAIREMAESLDIPIAGEGQIHVLFLENANATELASTLQGLTQSVEQAREETGSRRQRDDDDEEQSEPVDSGVGTISATFTGDVSITADEPTNSLVVVASLRDFLNLQRVVEQLDRRREQVYVEAVIMEVTVESDGEFGLAFNAGALPSIDGEDIPIFGATQVGNLSSVILDPTSLMGLSVGLRGPEVEGTEGLLGGNFGLPSFGAILTAIQRDRNVNVLATPHILTTDNEEATIVVGQNVPFVTGGSGNVGSLLNTASSLMGDEGTSDILSQASNMGFGFGMPSFSVSREDVSLTLTIEPQINESNYVRLRIEEEVDGIIGIDPVLGPTTSTRRAQTTVVVEDQQTVVIGGLIEDEITESVQKVPILGDIPILGYLFRYTTTRVVKRNLLLLLTPYIIRDSSDFHEIFRRKMRERQEFLEFFGRDQLDYVAGVDYARKNGPFESIVQTIQEAVDQEEARRRAQGVDEGPQLSPTLDALPVGAIDGDD